jgi:hypothetical protein
MTKFRRQSTESPGFARIAKTRFSTTEIRNYVDHSLHMLSSVRAVSSFHGGFMLASVSSKEYRTIVSISRFGHSWHISPRELALLVGEAEKERQEALARAEQVYRSATPTYLESK